MAKYLLLKHYQGGPAPVVDFAPADQWKPEEWDAHVQFMRDFGSRLEETGELVDVQALTPGGAFVRYDGEGKPPVTDGPFAETKELVAGYWIWQVRSMEEAIEWVKRCPNPMMSDSDIEIRPFFEAEDFGAEFTPELREQEDRLRAEIEGRNHT